MPRSQSRLDRKRRQEQSLEQAEADLRRLALEQKKDEFFARIMPLLHPIRSYIARRLRVAYADQELRTPLYTSNDILNEVILRAYQPYPPKPPDLTLEQWLYRLANEVLEQYLSRRKSYDQRRRSLEDLRVKELRGLEEVEHVTADVEGEPWLVEDLDDAEYNPPDFTPPSEPRRPEEELERREQLSAIISAVARLPQRDRIVFELFAMEGFPPDAVSRIVGVSADEVPRIAQQVRRQIRQQIAADSRQRAS